MSEVILNQILTELKEIKHEQVVTNQRIDRLDKRIDGLDQRIEMMDKRIDGLDQRIEMMDKRIDGLDQRIGMMDKRIDGLDQRIGSMDKRIDGLDKRIRAMDTRIDDNTSRLDSLTNTVKLIHDQTVKLTEYHLITTEALKRLASNDDVDYLIDKVSEHDREIYKIKNTLENQTSNE
ncbi:hypothetical protein [Amphibacillus indicireducens]|uniref:t-SNARE coiled-coil homology domain-containing protein n=1 Tax=Amphibacillus indicireducens TaxID=1076330 RepID=A0ABP7VRK2_9BACI